MFQPVPVQSSSADTSLEFWSTAQTRVLLLMLVYYISIVYSFDWNGSFLWFSFSSSLVSPKIWFNVQTAGGQGGHNAIQPEDIPQCFSHFTYQATARKSLVCDLQVLYHPHNCWAQIWLDNLFNCCWITKTSVTCLWQFFQSDFEADSVPLSLHDCSPASWIILFSNLHWYCEIHTIEGSRWFKTLIGTYYLTH